MERLSEPFRLFIEVRLLWLMEILLPPLAAVAVAAPVPAGDFLFFLVEGSLLNFSEPDGGLSVLADGDLLKLLLIFELFSALVDCR